MSSMQKNRYQEMRERHQAEVNDFPLMFAFDARQFAEGLRRLGLRSSDKDKVCALPGTGGFCRKSDLPALKGMFARHHRELQEAIGADPTGRGFIYEMFRTELSNHEYAYTQDVSETLDYLGITQQMLEAVPQLQTGLALACRSLLKHAGRARAASAARDRARNSRRDMAGPKHRGEFDAKKQIPILHQGIQVRSGELSRIQGAFRA